MFYVYTNHESYGGRAIIFDDSDIESVHFDPNLLYYLKNNFGRNTFQEPPREFKRFSVLGKFNCREEAEKIRDDHEEKRQKSMDDDF